jgi:gas vesicle protein
MKLRNKALFNTLLGAGLYLLDPVRDRLTESIEDFTDRAQDTYETAAQRMERASRAIRGDDSHFMSAATALLIGVGLGVSVGMLFAPASGEEIRSNLADKVHDFGDKVRNRFSSEPHPASGTYGE